MKNLSKISLVIFYIAVIAFFIRSFKPTFLEGIDDLYFNLGWPLALLVYGISKAAVDKKEKAQGE